MKKLLIIKGAGGSGKSTTIRLAFESFLRKAIRDNGNTSVEYLYMTNIEVAAIINYKKTRIGFATKGDTKKQVEEGLNFFKKRKCHIIVCASRSKGKSIEFARSFSKEVFKKNAEEWVKNKSSGKIHQNTENMKVSREIIKWILP